MPDLYGDLNGFLENFPADKIETFMQSKNLLDIPANRDVCVAFGPTAKIRAFAKNLLCMQCINIRVIGYSTCDSYLCCPINSHLGVASQVQMLILYFF